jgi:riboflavin kinase/FMN adenylyltransferase
MAASCGAGASRACGPAAYDLRSRGVQWWSDLSEVPSGLSASVVAIGVFDGVHLGHREIVARAVAAGRRLGVPSVVLTFEPHPAEVVRPGSAPLRLTSVAEKAALIGELGADDMLVLAFTSALSQLEPEEFVRKVLHEALHARVVVVGENFRYGRRAAGDVAQLRTLGAEHGFDVDAVGLVQAAGRTVSSSEIRALIADGDVESAAVLLGRLPHIDGPVVRGDARGRELGYPTANLALRPGVAVPADGVYAGWLHVLDGEAAPYEAAISVGTNPTFDGVQRRVEAYVIGHDAGPGDPGYLDLYDREVRVEFAHRLRGMVRFDSIDALIEQMAGDVREARTLLAGGR